MKDKYTSVMAIANRPDLVMVRGKGSRLWDTEGREYLDFVQGWAVNCLGHCPEVIMDALSRQSQVLINPSPAFYNRPMIELSERLVQTSGYDEVFLANSGAEANEGAIKLARKWGQLNKNGAYKIISMENGFHGRTLATMSASGKPQWDLLYEPKLPGFHKVPFNDIEALRAAIDEQTVAVMLEPIQGEAGVIPAHQDYLRQVRQLTRERNLLLIFDEVQTGIGRTGELFAQGYFGVEADIMTLGKGLGGGVPLAALMTRKSFSCFEAGDQGGTYNGNPLMAAVGKAVLDTVASEAFLQTVRERAAYLELGLRELAGEVGGAQVRGAGLLQALLISGGHAPTVVERARESGLLLNAPRPDIIRFMPALNVGEEDIDHMLAMLKSILV